MDAQSALAAGQVSDKASLNALIQNAYETFGSNVDLSKLAQSLGMSAADLQNILGSDQQKLAQENTDAGTSTEARLNTANQDSIRKITADLNKRGLLHSGETGFELDRQNTSYRQAQSDAYQKFLGYLQQYQQGYASAQQQRAGQLAGAFGDAANRVEQNNHGTAGITATFDHTDSAGRPVYRAPDGSFYNGDGSPYTAPTPTPEQNSTYQTVVSPGGGTMRAS